MTEPHIDFIKRTHGDPRDIAHNAMRSHQLRKELTAEVAQLEVKFKLLLHDIEKAGGDPELGAQALAHLSMTRQYAVSAIERGDVDASKLHTMEKVSFPSRWVSQDPQRALKTGQPAVIKTTWTDVVPPGDDD